MNVTFQLVQVGLDLGLGGNFGAALVFDLGGARVGSLKDERDALHDFKVSNGEVAGAADVLLAVTLQALIEEGNHLIEVSEHVGIVIVLLFGAEDSAAHKPKDVVQILLKIVNKAVNLPGSGGVSRVVAKADAKHAQDGARLAIGLTIFLPDGEGAKRESGLE